MKNQKLEQDETFRPPHLPISWIVSTFVVPILILLIPSMIKSLQYDFKSILIIALCTWGILLFVVCIMLMLKIYNTSFLLQLQKRDLNQLSQKNKEAAQEVLRLSEQLNNVYNELKENLQIVKQEQREFADFLNKSQPKQ